MTRRAPFLALALVLVLVAITRSLAFDDPATPEQARATWKDFCQTRMMRPDVPEEGAAVLDALLAGGVAPASAWHICYEAAYTKEWNAAKLKALKKKLEGKTGADLEAAAKRGVGLGTAAWDIDWSRSRGPAGSPIARDGKRIIIWETERGVRYRVYLWKEAKLCIALAVTAAGEKLAIVDRNEPVGWESASILVERDDKLSALDPAKERASADEADAKGAVEVPKDYTP